MTDGPFTEAKELIAGLGGVDGRGDRMGLDFPPELFSPELAAPEQALREELQRKAAKP